MSEKLLPLSFDKSQKVTVDRLYEPSKEELIKHLEGHFAKWQMPDDVVYEDELPLTATGKVSKLTLRQKYENYTLAS